MAYRFFTIPIRSAEAAEAELNGCLRGHRVLATEWLGLAALVLIE